MPQRSDVHLVIFPILHSAFGGFLCRGKWRGILPLVNVVIMGSGQSTFVCVGIFLICTYYLHNSPATRQFSAKNPESTSAEHARRPDRLCFFLLLQSVHQLTPACFVPLNLSIWNPTYSTWCEISTRDRQIHASELKNTSLQFNRAVVATPSLEYMRIRSLAGPY